MTSNGPGGAMFRRYLPAVAGMMALLACVRLAGEIWGLFGMVTGVALMTLAPTAGIGALLWRYGLVMDRNHAARRRDEQELARSGRYFEISRDCVCTAGFDGVFTQLNAAWTETLGWSEAELCSRPFVEFIHPDDRARTERETAGLANGGVTVDFVNRYATKSGSWRWMDWRAVADAEEGVIYASARDITERKEAEAARQAGERQTSQIIDTAQDAFIAIDAQGLITNWNPQAEATFGWSRAEMLGHDLAEAIVPEEHRQAHRAGIEHFLATGEGPVVGKRLEMMALHREGREFPVELMISAVEAEHGFSFNAFLRDITERKRAQEDLVLARDQALEASRMKSMFVANVSHEIRTPMNGVIGMTALLTETELDPEQREYAETIASSGDALLEVIDDILDFSKIEAGKLELDPTDFDLPEAIEQTCGMLAARAHEKNLELAVGIEPDLPERVRGDAARLRQVLANFVSNAIKFTAEGQVVVRAGACPGHNGTPHVRMEVSDTGIGIGREALGELFKPFSQADGSTTRKYGGTGLGLAISRQLIEMMGGTIGADSQPGKGSSFWFEVPLPQAESTAEAREGERDLAGLRVLVVDDNVTNRRILERQLNSWQTTCDVAEDAAQAMELMESARHAGRPYALALLDLNMPDVDGYRLARAIRTNAGLSGTRLVLLTSSGARTDVGEEAVFDGLLSKPVRQSRLYEEIQSVMSGGGRSVARRARTEAADAAEGPRQGVGSAVLVVEDTPVNQLVATRMLERCGFQAHVAENGREALKALSEASYAAVLMDCQMPELDGYETTREVRRREAEEAHIPIIAMTANSMEGERERCLAAGMDDYLTKPLRSQVLRHALARWISEPPAAISPLATDVQSGETSAQQLLDSSVIGDLDALGEDVLPGLLSLYFDDAHTHLATIRDAAVRGEAVAIAQTAHMLKGSSGSVGAARVSRIAAELEVEAKAGDVTCAGDLLDALARALDETQEAFRHRSA